MCKKRKSGELFAVKCFKVEDEHLLELKANFRLLRQLRHPGVIRYEALYIDMRKHQGWLVMEYFGFPTLEEQSLSGEEEIRNVAGQLLETLAFLHRNHVAHRDVKADNVLYDRESGKIKLIDFGLAKRFKVQDELVDLLTNTGTLYYRAPEMFVAGGYRESVDVWAAGVLLYRLMAGYTPFETEYLQSTVERIRSGRLSFDEKRFRKYAVEAECLIAKMLNRDCEKRLSADACLSEPWF